MNKKLKTLLAAGLVTVMTGANVVSSSALCKGSVNTYKKGVMYLYVNGVKYRIPLGCINKPSIDEDDSTTDDDNTSGDINNGNNDTNTGNDNNISNDNNNGNNDSNIGNDNNNGNDSSDDSTSGETESEFSAFQKEVVRLVNVERAKKGLKELKFNEKLSNVATIKSQYMINKNYFSHTSPTYGSPFDMMKQFNISYRYAGENIAKGQKTPAQVVEAWMNSKGHRENILNANFTEIGVGVAKDANGSLYWTQMFIGK